MMAGRGFDRSSGKMTRYFMTLKHPRSRGSGKPMGWLFNMPKGKNLTQACPPANGDLVFLPRNSGNLKMQST